MTKNDGISTTISRIIGSVILGTLLVGLIGCIIIYLDCNHNYVTRLWREQLVTFLTFPIGSLICGVITYKFSNNSVAKKIIFGIITFILSYPGMGLMQIFFVIGGC